MRRLVLVPTETTNLREIRCTMESNLINLSPYTWVTAPKSKKQKKNSSSHSTVNNFELGVREVNSKPFYFPRGR